MDRGNEKALQHQQHQQQQQQHVYSALHHSPGQQALHQQQGYIDPHSMSAQPPHMSQIQPESHLHLLQHGSSPGNTQIRDSWDQPADSSQIHSQTSQQHQQPQQHQQQQQQQQQHQQQQQASSSSSSHYGASSNPLFKGATEHLLSAVQQQWDSMRDLESPNQPKSPEPMISEPTASRIYPDGRDNTQPGGHPVTPTSVETPVTGVHHERISQANLDGNEEREPDDESMASDDQSQKVISDINTHSTASQQTANQDSVTDGVHSPHPQGESTDSSSAAAVHDSRPIEHESDTNASQLNSHTRDKDNIHTSESSTVNSSAGMIPLYSTPKSSEKEKEKGVLWQSLFIGGKMVKYKVLGNVKVHKASPVAAKKSVTPKAITSSKPEGNTTKLPIVKLKDIGQKFKIVKVPPGPPGAVSKPGRPPSNTTTLQGEASATKKRNASSTPSVQGILCKPFPVKLHKLGRPRTPGSRLTKPVKKDATGSGGKDSSAIVKQKSTDKDALLPSDKTVSEKPPDREQYHEDETSVTTSRRKRPISLVSDQKNGSDLTKEGATGDDSDLSDPTYTAKARSPRLKKKHKHKRKKIKVEAVPERRSPRKKRPVRRKPMYLEEDILSNTDLEEDGVNDSEEHLMIDSLKGIVSYSDQEDDSRTKAPKKKRFEKSSIVTRWPYQEIKPLVGFILSAKKAGVFKKEWPTIRDNESFWERAADCCNAIRIEKKKRTGTACAHWTHCYLKFKFTTTSQMNYHFNCAESKSKEYSAVPDQYETCRCYKPPLKMEIKKEKHCKSKRLPGYPTRRECAVQATPHSSFKETQTSVTTVAVSNGLKDFVSMLSANDALEVADLALHYVLKEKNLFNVADNFLELCVGAFTVLQKYRHANVIEEFARVVGTRRDDGLPRMQPDKMPFAMIAYNIRYFNNTSPFGLTVPLPYAEWLHSMYNIFGQRFHELFEGPTPDKLEIADRHPYRSQLLNVATVSKAYLKRQTDEKDKAEAEKPLPAEELQEGSQENIRRKMLMNKQGRTLRELMTDVAIPPVARRKLQQAFAIMQRTSSLTAPDNEPTCEHCGAAIPRPPKPPRKYTKRKRDRKRLKGDGLLGSKHEGIKKRRTEGTKKNMSRQASKSNVAQSSHQGQEPLEPIQHETPGFPTHLYRTQQQRSVELDRMLINAPGMRPARELPANLQTDKWMPTHPGPSHQGWSSGNHQISNVAAAAAVAAARGVYDANQRTVDIMWQPGQPSTGWHQGEVQRSTAQPQQQQHTQRTQMEASTSSGVHVGQTQNTHAYYPLTHSIP